MADNQNATPVNIDATAKEQTTIPAPTLNPVTNLGTAPAPVAPATPNQPSQPEMKTSTPLKKSPMATVKAVPAKPAVTATPKAKPAATAKPVQGVVDAGGLIAQTTAAAMAQHAGTPPAAPTSEFYAATTPASPLLPVGAPVAPLKSRALAPSPALGARLTRLYVSVMFTLNLSDPRFYGSRKQLETVPSDDGSSYNLYNPFRKTPKAKAGEAPGCEGALRHSLEQLLTVTDEINGNRIMYLGSPTETKAALTSALGNVHSQVDGLLPFPSDQPIGESASVEDQERGAAPMVGASTIMFKDAIRVSSWLNSPQVLTAEDVHNGVVNFTVNTGALYDSNDRMKYVKQVDTILTLISRSVASRPTNMVLAVSMRSSMLSNALTREFIDQMLAEEDFCLFTKSELTGGNLTDWTPTTPNEVETCLLSEGSDLLFVKILGASKIEAPTPD